MVQHVEIRSDDRDALVRLSYHPVDQDFGTLAVEIRAGGLAYDESVLSAGGDGLAAFLAGLAADWRGWDGPRTWDAIEHGMTIEATHHGKRVELLFIVRRDNRPDAWEARLPILVAPGESLARVAIAGQQLFAATE
jgi:hypothetical protein